MDRTRKKSSKQALEDKQMKRYFRSKKRSHKRSNPDDEQTTNKNPEKGLTENVNQDSKKYKEANTVDKHQNLSSKSSGSNQNTNENCQGRKEVRKVSKKVITNDSSENKTSVDKHLHCEEEVKIIKKEKLSTHQNFVEITSTSEHWVEDLNIMNKEMFSENLNKKMNVTKTDHNMNGNFINTSDNLEIEKNTHDAFRKVSLSDMNEETIRGKMDLFEGTTKEKLTIIDTKCQTDQKTEQIKASVQKAIKDDNTHLATNNETGNKEEVKCKTYVTSIQTDNKVETVEGKYVESEQTIQLTVNDEMPDKLSACKNERTVSTGIDNMICEDQTKQNLLESCWLESKNVCVDQYKHNEAEKQFYQQLAQQKKWKSDSQENKNKINACKDLKITVKENGDELRGNVEKLDKTKYEEKETTKPKPRVAYEIIEEIIERTEITYHLVHKETDDVHMKEQIKEFETQNLDFKQYISQLGGYVKSLEDRVKTLEKGQINATGERSSSLSSNTSDEGVDMTGGVTANSISVFRMKGQKNERLNMHDEMKNLTNLSKNKNGSMVL
eukprot:GFUD01034925.1.p1 GENE.GFUD01034925.1~~GFUD01034925.1.p1  ORF type:complete len:554 (-),score=180.65 GFUD01034925.1:74-1735(-)